ncbi:MAG TPA: hypothetical protein VGM37_19330 [Armatimonadota bacterium]|jgi:hypothetical protein
MRPIHLMTLLLAAGAAANAGAPLTIPFQARLNAAKGAPVDGPVGATFRLYDAAGALVWAETKSVTAFHGLLQTNLGDASPLPAASVFAQPLTLGIQVGADPEMTPRLSLSPAPAALHASRAADLALPWTGAASAPGGSVLKATNSANGAGVRGEGVFGIVGMQSGAQTPQWTPASGAGVFGAGLYGVLGISTNGPGVAGSSAAADGVLGVSETSHGVRGMTTTGVGVNGIVNSVGQGVLGEAFQPASVAVQGVNLSGTAVLGRGLGADNEANSPFAGVSGVGVIGVRGHSPTGAGLDADSAGPGPTAAIRNTGSGPAAAFSGSGPAVLQIRNTGAGDILSATDRAGAPALSVSAAGGLTSASGEFSAWLPSAGACHAGDALAVRPNGHLEPSGSPYQTNVVGICRADVSPDAPLVSTCVTGLATVRVCPENGPIAPGDLLVTSSTPGCAMKGTDAARLPGAILGKALEPFTAPGPGAIRAVISLR